MLMRKFKKLSGRYLTNISCGHSPLKYLLLIHVQINAILAAHSKSGLNKSFLAMIHPASLKPGWSIKYQKFLEA